MVATAKQESQDTIHTIHISKEIEVDAPFEITFEAILAEIGPGSELPDGTPMPFKIEPWPGGRWYRDLGDNAGHLWGHVQVIKPPKLLEISGPMFMSYPAVNFIQYRLTSDGAGTRLHFTHRGFGLIPAEHREGVNKGWDHGLKRIREIAARLASERR
jgi:Activator of Hsp90 ATPase homolog 1-like protein